MKLVTGGLGVATLTDASNPIPVTLATAGTATPVTQSGTFTVQPGNTANSTPWLVSAAVSSVPAAARTTDSIAVYQGSDKLMNNLTAVTPTYAAISAASNGNNTLLAAQGASNIIVVHSLVLVATTAVTAKFQSAAGGTDLTGAMPLGANGGIVLPFSPVGWFRTAANALLNLSLGGAVQVSGNFCYSVVA